jgi:hypothetical protein
MQFFPFGGFGSPAGHRTHAHVSVVLDILFSPPPPFPPVLTPERTNERTNEHRHSSAPETPHGPIQGLSLSHTHPRLNTAHLSPSSLSGRVVPRARRRQQSYDVSPRNPGKTTRKYLPRLPMSSCTPFRNRSRVGHSSAQTRAHKSTPWTTGSTSHYPRETECAKFVPLGEEMPFPFRPARRTVWTWRTSWDLPGPFFGNCVVWSPEESLKIRERMQGKESSETAVLQRSGIFGGRRRKAGHVPGLGSLPPLPPTRR